MKRSHLLLIAFLCIAFVATAAPTRTLAGQGTEPPVTSGRTLHLLGIDLGCYPEQAPSKNGCGLDDFIKLLKEIINYLTVIIFPLAAAMLVWGGLVIMTAAGSTERVGKGKQIITTAIIGVAIALGSWLIINAIYLALTGKGV